MANIRKSLNGPTEGKTRVPISGHRDILRISADQDFYDENYLYWANDIKNEIHHMTEAGYEFVEKSEIHGMKDKNVSSNEGVDSRVSKVVGTDRGGNPILGYLMKQKREWHEEDVRMKNEKVDATERAMRGESKNPGMYGNIQVTKE